MTAPVISLDVDGIIDDPVVKANKLFEYYLRSNFSQSMCYYGTICSFNHDVRTSGMATSEMILVSKKALITLFTPHYTSVDISTRVTKGDGPTYILHASGTLIDGLNRYDLDRSVNFSFKDLVEEQAANE